MRVPIEWLHEYCAPALDAHTLAERLALSGTEVERVEHHGVMAPENFVVGKVLERRKHPDADRLSVCEVDLGASSPSQIVCGAANVAAGQTVGVARPGAVMPDGSKLRKVKLRGQESGGMILAEDEVAIGVGHQGIMVLDDDLQAGTPLLEVLPIATDVLVLEITPNRPDCLGIYGVAREVAASTGAELKPPPWADDPGSFGDLAGIEIANDAGGELCPRFTARIFDGIRLAQSPYWLKARLMAAGQRPISNVVDVTNYVMLLTGQPMHAFDYGRIAGRRLTIRRARAGERMQTLDDRTRSLDEQMLVIDDADGPTSIAGVMGGARSEVSETTTAVLSEVAVWNGPNIHRTGLRLGLRSEASNRFEKQLQPEQALWGQAVATRLFVELCGASVRPGTVDLGGPGPAPATIRLREQRLAGLLGRPVPRGRARSLLEAIGCTVADAADGLDVTVPDFRRDDITREADLIEEVARLDGLDKLPATLPARRAAVGALSPAQRLRRRAADLLAAQGFNEIVGWSFTGPDLARRLRLLQAGSPVVLANPMSIEQSQLRTTLLGSLLDAVQRNRARGAEAVALFELGAVYRRKPGAATVDEPRHLAAVITGPARAATWREARPPAADFFTAKAALAGLLDGLRADWSVHADGGGDGRAPAPFLHPGRSARVVVAGVDVGWLGELHPKVAEHWDLEQTLAGFELRLDAIAPPPAVIQRPLPSFPDVREDLAVVVDEGVEAGAVLRVIEAAGSPLVAEADVFDVYRDRDRLGESRVSLAIRISYRAADRTLTDAEVARQRRLIVDALARELDGRIRGGE